QGIGPARIETARTLHVKYDGTDTTLELPTASGVADIVATFEARYRRQYGFLMPDKPLVIEAVAVEAVGKARSASEETPQYAERAMPLQPIRTSRMYTAGAFCPAAVYDRGHLRPGDLIDGPAVIAERNATTIVEPGWRADLTALDHLVLTRIASAERADAIGTTADP